MESNKLRDFKSNAADLTKIPPNEFENYFQDWMERDDVARSLQAKLRCDLIKNFNKTNLGKHILSHSITAAGGSALRLTLSPLILALNTLVAEFLYAQNCHFTLSVFCTEIPYRNTLPDFESVHRFRFNNEEIAEIWQAVTGSKANQRYLNSNIIQNYERDPNVSLLLLILKCLVKKDPVDQSKRNAEIQTEFQEKIHKSISAQASDLDRKSSSKTKTKDDSLHYINKYLLALSEKVVEMTREFEQFAKQTREARSRNQRSSRSREYYELNKSLERITENMKVMVETKCKNKRLSIIIESIDNLTQQFGKCAQNFENVTKVLDRKGDKPALDIPKPIKVKVHEKQTETDAQEKSYTDWIYEMRNTENGKKFLNRVESSLRKALSQYREQLERETDIKMKQLKSLLKLHYQHKLSKHLLQNPITNLDDARKCNDNIEKKLQQFEEKQLDLMQKLQESSLELKDAQLQQKSKFKLVEREKVSKKVEKSSSENILQEVNIGDTPKHDISLRESQNGDVDNTAHALLETGQVNKEKTLQPSGIDVAKAQEQILEIVQTISEQGRSVDRVIYDAKLRIQELENESNQLEQNFQSYLERRKRAQELENNSKKIPEIYSNLKDLYKVTMQEHKKPAYSRSDREQDEEIDEEFHRLEESIHQIHERKNDREKSAKSESSTSSLEIRNAILEAKLKFFEHENTIRKCRERGEEIRNGNFLEKQLQNVSQIQDLPDYFNHNSGQFIPQTNRSFETQTVYNDRPEFKIMDGEHESEVMKGKTPIAVRKELVRTDATQKDKDTVQNTLATRDVKNYTRYHEPTNVHRKDQEQYSEEEMLEEKSTKETDSTAKLIKQSMAKMQQLFEQQSNSQEALREMVNDLQQDRVFEREQLQTATKISLRPNEALEKSLTSTTMTSVTTTTSNTTKTSEDAEMENNPKLAKSVAILNGISNTSTRFLLNSSSESESSTDSNCQQFEMTSDKAKEIDDPPTVKKSQEIIIANTKRQQESTEINEYFQSSELTSPPSPKNTLNEEAEINLQLEFGQLNDSPKISHLNISTTNGSEKEIGEIYSESNRTFAPIDVELAKHFSSQSSSEFEISTGHQNNDAKNLADDSESDFWA